MIHVKVCLVVYVPTLLAALPLLRIKTEFPHLSLNCLLKTSLRALRLSSSFRRPLKQVLITSQGSSLSKRKADPAKILEKHKTIFRNHRNPLEKETVPWRITALAPGTAKKQGRDFRAADSSIKQVSQKFEQSDTLAYQDKSNKILYRLSETATTRMPGIFLKVDQGFDSWMRRNESELCTNDEILTQFCHSQGD